MRREKPARASFTSTSSRACKHCSTIPRASRRSRTVISTLKVTNIQQAYAMSSTVMSTRNLLEREVDQRSSFRIQFSSQLRPLLRACKRLHLPNICVLVPFPMRKRRSADCIICACTAATRLTQPMLRKIRLELNTSRIKEISLWPLPRMGFVLAIIVPPHVGLQSFLT